MGGSASAFGGISSEALRSKKKGGKRFASERLFLPKRFGFLTQERGSASTLGKGSSRMKRFVFLARERQKRFVLPRGCFNEAL